MLTTRSDSDSESLGLNLAPEALYEAQRQSQRFSFVPQERNAMGGLFPNNHNAEDPVINAPYPYFDNNDTNNMTFDHICPPGPLGLIIDTTTRGPMVHCVKPASILNGVLMPGDIVIGLDDRDTRNMTAPLITSLMASKSQQPQRKLTILRNQFGDQK